MNENMLVPEKEGTFRIIFFYVGQGESTLLIVPDGQGYQYILVDANFDKEKTEHVINLLKQLDDNSLIFINTHPHNDHVKGVGEIKNIVKEVWETGFEPSEDNADAKKALDELVSEMDVYYLRGTKDVNTLSRDGTEEGKEVHEIGEVDYQVFSPSTYIADDVDGDDDKIHEQCGVMKFTYKDKSILLTGDSDKKAWADYITSYYEDVLGSDVLSASHHGSRTFFKNGSDDEDVFEDHIKAIDPEYLVVSAPKQSDSPHDHPDDDAIAIYEKYVDAENIFHLGSNEKSMIVDIDSDGNINIYSEDSYVSDSDVLFTATGGSTRPYLSW